MSFATFPAALPYFEELRNTELLDKLIKGVSASNSVKALEISENAPDYPSLDDVLWLGPTTTTNGALTHASTRSAALDLYYGIQLLKWHKNIDVMYANAWKEDPDMTLHVLFYARSIHRGKSLTDPFFKGYGWLLKNHPQTALNNLHVLIDPTVRTNSELKHWRKMAALDNDGGDTTENQGKDVLYKLLERRDFQTHGCWKDLCTLLTIYCQGELDGPKNDRYLALEWPREKFDMKYHREIRCVRRQRNKQRRKMNAEDAAKDAAKYLALNQQFNDTRKKEAQQHRRDTRQQRQKVVSDLLQNDELYRALHFTVARLFANQLRKDMQQMEENRVKIGQGKLTGRHALGLNLSMAAKWAPSLCASHDKHTLLATSIAELLFEQEEGEHRDYYLNRARELYRKQYLAPLRHALDITEHYMQAGKWETVDLGHVPSVCLEKNMPKFFKHAPEMVVKYMSAVAFGKKKVSGETLGPHQLVNNVRCPKIPEEFSNTNWEDTYKEMQEQLVNGQWTTLINSLRDTSLLKSSSIEESKQKAVNLGECLAICDVSGSMFSHQYVSGGLELIPLNAAIGLSLVITNLAKPPFNGAIITFSDEPEVFKVDTSAPFAEQVRTVVESPMGFNTDIAKVFTDVLLPMAKKHNLAPEDMVKKLFIFSDMEFDDPSSQEEIFDGTTQEFIRKQFKDAGYEMPELVWWNLCIYGAYESSLDMNAPVTKDEANVSLLSGFSAAMVKTFLDGDTIEGAVKSEQQATEKEEEAPTKNPMIFARKAVYHESFQDLVVVD